MKTIFEALRVSDPTKAPVISKQIGATDHSDTCVELAIMPVALIAEPCTKGTEILGDIVTRSGECLAETIRLEQSGKTVTLQYIKIDMRSLALQNYTDGSSIIRFKARACSNPRPGVTSPRGILIPGADVTVRYFPHNARGILEVDSANIMPMSLCINA